MPSHEDLAHYQFCLTIVLLFPLLAIAAVLLLPLCKICWYVPPLSLHLMYLRFLAVLEVI
jgi:hypothetical protein